MEVTLKPDLQKLCRSRVSLTYLRSIIVASFPGPARSSLAVRNSRRGPISYCKRRTRRAWERGYNYRPQKFRGEEEVEGEERGRSGREGEERGGEEEEVKIN